MIRIHPSIEFTIECPVCNALIAPDRFHYTGLHILASGVCTQCAPDDRLYKEMPTSAGLFYPVTINDTTGQRVDALPFENWFTRGLEHAFKNKDESELVIAKVRNKARKPKALFLSTVDHTYGHCLFNLWNLDYYQQLREYHLILLVQDSLQWMVPDDVDEVWTINLSFAKADRWYTFLEKEIANTLTEFEEAFLAICLPQASEKNFHIERYTRVRPFPLEEWDERLSQPSVTFIWRRDRFWRRLLPRIVDNRITRRLFPKQLQAITFWLRYQWLFSFAKWLKKKIPSVQFSVAGMEDRKVKLPDWIADHRYRYHEDKTARDLCALYASSHLVIGCNGSSLVLPSAHAGGVINIVPSDGWAVSVGSFSWRITSLTDTFFRYLLLPPEITPKRLANITAEMLRDRTFVEMISGKFNDLESVDYSTWKDKRLKAFANTRRFNEESGLITIKRNSSTDSDHNEPI